MAAELLTDASKATDSNNTPYSGAKWYFYATGGLTPQAIYADAALSTAHTNPVVADSSGHFAPIYFDASKKYRGILKDSTDSDTLRDIDPINSALTSILGDPSGSSAVGFIQAGTGAVARTSQDKLREVISVTDFGAVGDGTNEQVEITAALAEIVAQGGGVLSFPETAAGGVFGLSETLQLPDNIAVLFQGGSVKVLGTTTYDAAFIGIPGAQNIEIYNPQIDCNNIAAACGIIMRRNNPDFRVFGGLIKNCAHDTTRKGGRAINIEAGVDPTTYGSRNAVVMGTIARDCYEGLSVSGGADPQQESNIRIDMIAENCQSGISLFGNTAGYPHGPDEMGAYITMTMRNCGKATTYSRVAGVVNSDRGSNIKLDIQVMNDSTYGSVGSLLRGDFSNCVVNAQMEGECTRALLDFASYQEVDAIDEDATWTSSGNTLSTLDSEFNVKHKGTIADVINLPIATAGFLTNCQFDLKTDVVTTLKPGNTNTANKTTCWARIQNKTSNATIEGFLSDIGSAATFANCANLNYSMKKGTLRASGILTGSTGTAIDAHMCTTSRVSTGLYDMVFLIAMPDTNYIVAPLATQSSTSTVQYREAYSKTTTGFRVETRNAGALVDPTTVEFTVTR